MSNPISLYSGNLQFIIEKLKSYDDEIEKNEEYELPFDNHLGDGDDTDYQLQDLGQLVEGKEDALGQPAMPFLRSFIWDWIDGDPIIDLDVDQDELGVNAIISSTTLQSMNLQSIDIQALSNALFSAGVCWESAEELANYLSIWHKAFSSAQEKGEGIVLKVWV